MPHVHGQKEASEGQAQRGVEEPSDNFFALGHKDALVTVLERATKSPAGLEAHVFENADSVDVDHWMLARSLGRIKASSVGSGQVIPCKECLGGFRSPLGGGIYTRPA